MPWGHHFWISEVSEYIFALPMKTSQIKKCWGQQTCPQGSRQCHRPLARAQGLCQLHQFPGHTGSFYTPGLQKSPPGFIIINDTSGTSEKSLKFSVFFSLKGVMSIIVNVSIPLKNSSIFWCHYFGIKHANYNIYTSLCITRTIYHTSIDDLIMGKGNVQQLLKFRIYSKKFAFSILWQ